MQGGAEAFAEDLLLGRTDRGVTVRSRDGRIELDLVEHLLAALGGLGVHGGIRISCDASELPLLDGGARRFAEALIAIGAPLRNGEGDCGPAVWVAENATLHHGMASYRFAKGPEIKLRVHVRFPPPVGEERAAWDGDPKDFLENIAPARTFGWAREHAALLAAGRARGLKRSDSEGQAPGQGIDPDSVIVFDETVCMPGCRPNEPGEIARHKLLDMVGDLTFYGGPPRGLIEAFAPGHTATHQVVQKALHAGILRRHQ
jgi:UDP-3-O-[3-hydroxymyristoyl] N-acetylglucosamine deacetylase